jgi:DNA-binding NarL/FixJ family response regulator
MSTTVKIILVDDHEIVRNGIKTLLESEPDLQVLGEAHDGIEALERIGSLQPDLLIMDIHMPRMNGIEATAKVKREHPKVKILILSMHDENEYIIRSVEAGADGYLLKDSSKQEFIKGIRTVMAGQKYYSGDISTILVNSYLSATGKSEQRELPTGTETDLQLTRREIEILRLIWEGKSNKDIAETLNKSVRTIETHRFNIMKKLEVGNVTELLRAIEHNSSLSHLIRH